MIIGTKTPALGGEKRPSACSRFSSIVNLRLHWITRAIIGNSAQHISAVPLIMAATLRQFGLDIGQCEGPDACPLCLLP